MAEEWRQVVGYEGLFEVSSLGRVRNPRTGTVRKPSENNCGYHQIALFKDGRSRSLKVHRIVAIAFIPNPDGKREVNHIDTARTNNAVTNLEWVDKYENHDHSARLGKYRAETNPRRVRKLSPAVLADCRERHAAGKSIRSLAKELGVCWSSVDRGVKGRASQSKRIQKEQT